MNFFEAIKICLSKYAVFSGRAGRSEYWYFTLFNSLIYFLFLIGNESVERIPHSLGTSVSQ